MKRNNLLLYGFLGCVGVFALGGGIELFTANAGLQAQVAQATPAPSPLVLLAGRKVYAKRCVPCHGLTGLGDGPRATTLPTRPANLQRSRMTDQQKEMIIRLGGQAVGKAAYMPPWGQELTDQQIKNLLVYLRAINVN